MELTGLMQLPGQGILVFGLLMTRFGALALTAPILSAPQVPIRVRVGLGALMALILVPLELARPGLNLPGGPGGLATAIAGEAFIGLVLGVLGMFILYGVQFAGYLIGLQMGFGMDQVYDPMSNQQLPSLALFLGSLAMLVLLLTDGHLAILEALGGTLEQIPLGRNPFTPALLERVLSALDALFTIAFALLFPILGVLLVAEIGLAVMNRMMPALNVFSAGFALKIAIGMGILLTGLPSIVHFLETVIARWLPRLSGFFGT
ncbi:MAG: flagellar biosynthetic protein FliR [Candidatus Sericytochromatia bacterium]|nr:flagellar biosynthetic protein FliR [Candidatus Sericytochromatia bacterium]